MKNHIVVLLVLCVALSLAACGSTSADETTAFDTTALATKTVYLVDTQIYEYDGLGTMTIQYFYDENGNPTQVKQTDENSEIIMTYAYGDNGMVSSMTQSTGGTTMVSTYTYDESNNLIAQEMKNGDTLTQSITYTYDEQGRLITMDADYSGYASSTTYTYGEYDLPSTATMVQNGVRTQQTFSFNEEGKYTGVVTTAEDGSVIDSIAVVYESNAETRTTTDAQGTVLQTHVRTYNEHGDVVSEEFISEYSKYTCTYTYITMEVPA